MAIGKVKKRLFSFGGQKPPAEIEIINSLEGEIEKLGDNELKQESLALRKRAASGESLEELLPRAFALVRESARRTMNQRHFDVQLWGGIVIHRGSIAEMLTGEGKTLAATAPIYLNALSGRGVHTITVNDYLAKRDAVWMGQIYHFLGLSVSCLVHDAAFMYDPQWKLSEEEREKIDAERDLVGSYLVKEDFLRPISRKEAYDADVTYGTNHEFGFDYLRDNIRNFVQEQVQRELNYAVIDEIDSILIDEARTPLIISAPDTGSSEYYKLFANAVRSLKRDEDYIVDEKLKSVEITEPGIDAIEKITGINNIYAVENFRLVHYLEASLKAKALFEKDKDYVIKNGEVIIVDQFTGRLMFGRRYSAGLHQAIEAKEGVAVQEESKTFAQITLQNYFRLYKKISGMTGTAQTSAEEFHKVYGMEVVSIPTNKPLIRNDMSDLVYKNLDAKYKAIVKDVKRRHELGQPILLGAVSIEKNELLSGHLKRAGIPHEVLNAKNNEREGAIIAQAGRVGAVTVATNMAGRGVDIIFGGNPPNPEEAEKVRKLGGLHVLGTERHEARRIDNQLRGRAGRQGDPGSSQFFLSLEDDLLRVFGGEKVGRIMDRFDLPDDLPIENKMVTKAISQAQSKVEGFNFDARKNLLEYDDILNKQRTVFYTHRQKIVEAISPAISSSGQTDSGDDGGGEVATIKSPDGLRDILKSTVSNYLNKLKSSEINAEDLKKVLSASGVSVQDDTTVNIESIKQMAVEKINGYSDETLGVFGFQLLTVLNILWMNHLENIEALSESVRLRAYGQRDPLVEYRSDGRRLFDQLNSYFDEWVFQNVFRAEAIAQASSSQERASVALNPKFKGVGRNDPCPCGSGKKYKKCHRA